jgi:AraC-like DNA-binding protein
MVMAQAYRDIGFQALFDQPKVASLDDVLILNDNFDVPIHLDPTVNTIYKGVPNKIVSTITILVCLEGQIDVANNFTDYSLKKNDAIINRSGTLGQFYGMSDDAKFFLLVISNNFYFPTLISGDSSEMLNLTVTHPVCHMSDETTVSMLQLYTTLKNNLLSEERPLFIREITRGLVEGIMFHLISSLVREVRSLERQHRKLTRNQDIYERFMHLIELNFKRERDISFYADKLCLTPKYLSQIIYKESGSYAGDHIKRFVIMEAKALIKSRQYTMNQICDILNFNSQSFFTKYFKNATGMSPTEYQNS